MSRTEKKGWGGERSPKKRRRLKGTRKYCKLRFTKEKEEQTERGGRLGVGKQEGKRREGRKRKRNR